MLWSTEVLQKTKTISGLSGDIRWSGAPVLSRDGQYLACANQSGAIEIWSLNKSEFMFMIEGPLRPLAFSPEAKLLASCSLDNTARLWATESFDQVTEFSGHKHHVYAVSFSPDGRVLATASIDNTARLWDVQSGNVMSFVDGHVRYIRIHWNGVKGFDGLSFFYEPPDGYESRWSDR